MGLLNSVFGRSGFLLHGYCVTWTPGLLWSMVGADAVIAAGCDGYLSKPINVKTFAAQVRACLAADQA